MTSDHVEIHPAPSLSVWTVAIVCASLVSATLIAAASWLWVESKQPVGEGELFYGEAQISASRVDSLTGEELGVEIRHVRNDLALESVSIADPDGIIRSSTSRTLIGTAPVSPLITGLIEGGRFGAIAATVTTDIEVDGVVEHRPGDVLYEVVHPLSDASSLLLSYDFDELLERRARLSSLSPWFLPLGALALASLMAAVVLSVLRRRVIRNLRMMTLENEFIRRHSEALAVHNKELALATAVAQEALALAEEKNRIRSEFVLMINHELRTPLTGVITGARLLAESDRVSDPADVAILDDIVVEGERLQGIIGQMLAVARIENRGLFVSPSEVTLADLEAQIRMIHRRATMDFDDDIQVDDARVVTDTTTLVQLLASLVDNAHTHGARDVAIRVCRQLPFTPTLELSPTPPIAVHFVVIDDGPGIDPDFLPRAFEKFEKDSQSAGTGLGLYLARMMADAIGASIAITSDSSGTAIAISVPGVPARDPVAV